MIEYIHYGANKFDINKFEIIQNSVYFNKPIGGLWASPIDAKFGWREWCEEQDFRDCDDDNSFKFVLPKNANVYYIDSVSDCLCLPKIKTKFMGSQIMGSQIYPNFENMINMDIDAIQFNLSNDNELYWTLYGWDCDCILILNKDIIKPIIYKKQITQQMKKQLT